ncbi:MAG: isoleucine--tRNA ligase [bacterium]|nr:isoleucine--tRNA ligase [bacterium]
MADAKLKSETAKREEVTLAFWKEHKIFEKSLQKDAPKGEYVFYDGPPFATGLPHYGHIVASVIKDVVPRYWTMRGYHVPRVWGWDCHGLPIENIVEKELGFKHKKDIKEYGIAKFNERCRERVLTYASEWEKIIPRIGRWADMEHAYRTMDKPFMESVWWVFKQIYDQGLVYKDYRSMHICPRCETTLSQQEVAEGYKDVKDISVTVKFKLKNPVKLPFKIPANASVYMLAWTTTPWTLPGNVALAVNNDVDYRLVLDIDKNEVLIVSDRYHTLNQDFHNTPNFAMLPTQSGAEALKGHQLVGLEYEPLFDYYANDTTLKNRENGWKVYAADFITTEAGTGIAHEAPAFGADDWELAKKENLPFVQHVNMDGTFKPEVADFAGIEVKPIDDPQATDVLIIKHLAHKGLLFSKEKVEHSYPHCWRCETPLLNYATSSWFVSVTKLKENLLENAKNINWSPAHIKEGRFGDWLQGARDWSISRQRFWASVIPIWKCEKCKKLKVFGSVAELEEASGKKVDDLHKHIVDEITVPCVPSEALAKEGGCGGEMRRVPDVLDTWFDSGSMPYGERHYPFAFSTDSKGTTLDPTKLAPWSKTFPAQFIAEGLDQTRAWFYYLHVFAGALFKKNAFQNVIVNGIVLAEDGKKMSKKLQNYPDPMEVVDKYGADALRFYLLSSPVMQAENLSFSEKGVDEVAKKNISRLGNVLAFYQMYADDTRRGSDSANVLDRWILARLDQLIRESTQGFEKYQLDTATRPIVLFIDDLSVWYLRRSRERFKKGGDDAKAARAILRHVLYTLSLIIAPSMPFLAEHLFQAVKEGNDPESVHLAEWPSSSQTGFLAQLFGKKDSILRDMVAARSIVTQALEARDVAKIKVRQPLQKLTVNSKQLTGRNKKALLQLIQDEVNVKEIETGDTIMLDTNITDELREEGIVRDKLREVQTFRKEKSLRPGEHTSYTMKVSEAEKSIVEKHKEIIEMRTDSTISVSLSRDDFDSQ